MIVFSIQRIISLSVILLLTACGSSEGDAKRVARVTCAVMIETRKMDAAIRVEKINEAREAIGGKPFLLGDDVILEAFSYGLCEELILNEDIYTESVRRINFIQYEEERRAAEEKRRAAEEKAKEEKMAAEKKAEEERIAAEEKAEEEINETKELIRLMREERLKKQRSRKE